MASGPPSLGEFARSLVQHEAGGSADPAALAAAVEMACGRLKGDLADLLGSGGVSALFRRALHLAQRERHLLVGVSVDAGPAACFAGLAEALAAGTDEEAVTAAAALLAHLFGLLVSLLGEELGMRPVRKLWPHVTSIVTEYDE